MSKGGSSSQTTEIPAWLENAAIQNINKANDVSNIGYTPYYGPDVAALSPMQQQSMQSTGNAASAFGLAPQGFDAMAGMPQAQTFANGMQGYSSAPLYQESVDQFQANRPAQFQAMADMFIDPFTGAPAKNNYAASPEQVQQMFSNSGGGGGITPTGGGGNSSGNNDGDYFGVNSQYNPYGYSTPTEDISGDSVVDYKDMSFGEAGRRPIGFGENVGNFIESITPIGAIKQAVDYGQGLADGFTPSPSNGLLSQTSGPSMTQAEAVNQMNQASDKYEAQNLADQYALYGAGQNFSSANTPTNQVEALAPNQVPDFNFPMGTEEDLSQVAQTTPYDAPQISSPVSNPVIEPQTPAIKGLLADQLTSEYDLQTGLQDELAQDAADKKAKDAVLAKAKAKKIVENSGKGGGGDVIKKKKVKPKKIVENSGKGGGGGGGDGGDGGSAGSSGGGTYCCTKMRDNGNWTSNRRVYKMHKWHFEQPQWWRDGYDVWGKVIADNLLNKDGEFSASVMNNFYENRVNGGKLNPKAALAHAVMYPPIFMIGMVAKVTGKHITKVTITS